MADRHSKNIENVEKKVTETVLTRGTLASRMINPELFVRPNKIVMGVGLIMLTGCVICLAYMNSDQKPVQVPATKSATSKTKGKSKWD